VQSLGAGRVLHGCGGALSPVLRDARGGMLLKGGAGLGALTGRAQCGGARPSA